MTQEERARLEALCKRWDQQAAKAETEVEGREGAGAWGLAGNIVGTRQCAADLRALLAEPQRVRMEPQPVGGCVFILRDTDGVWVCWNGGGDGYAISSEYTAPSPAHRPVLVDGVWWWEVRP